MAIKYAILGLLHYKDLHGYQIKKNIERNFGHMWSINYGQIYPNLKQLKNEGLVTMREVNQVGVRGPGRKLYSLTNRGRQEFSRWLEQSPERNMLLRDPFMMRFVFFGFGDRDRAVALIDEQIQLYEQQLEKRRENMKRWESHDIYVRLIAELGLDFNKMYLEWFRKARDAISRASGDEVTAKRAADFA